MPEWGKHGQETPFNELHILTADSGFYSGFSKSVAIPSKILVSALIVWTMAVPETAAAVLNALNGAILKRFVTWYICAAAGFFLLCILLAVVRFTDMLKLGRPMTSRNSRGPP
ncbi:hypothetical protein DL1_17015 [Thioclava dalianensis]|uniref:Uncharacterized protein n=1 Tax=Thioclava dalianensis TaxID=1185766 RepID=A0A074TZU2_9RHOB|nr:hypothetical protein DL1_17015 [Thioclava dalianensis]SFN59716.1 BCCT, betaine/carnitine/choline family transporter [Thioclava dalianensis]